MAYHHQQGVDTAIVRIFNTYGPRMRPHDGRGVSNFLRQALAGRPITVFGDGSQTRSFCYVDDLIRGIIPSPSAASTSPVNIGNPNEFTLLELAPRCIEVTGRTSRDRLRGAADDDPMRASPTSRAPGSCSAGSRRSGSRGPGADDRGVRAGRTASGRHARFGPSAAGDGFLLRATPPPVRGQPKCVPRPATVTGASRLPWRSE